MWSWAVVFPRRPVRVILVLKCNPNGRGQRCQLRSSGAAAGVLALMLCLDYTVRWRIRTMSGWTVLPILHFVGWGFCTLWVLGTCWKEGMWGNALTWFNWCQAFWLSV